MIKTKKKKYKYSILTFIFGNYEMLHEIGGELESDVEYICVTDNKELKSNTWKIVLDKELNGKTPFDKCFSVRYNPFKYCHSDICVRIDGSIGILKSITPFVEAFINGGYDCSFMLHPYRNNVVDEFKMWGKHRNYDMDKITKQVLLLNKIGYTCKEDGLLQIGLNIIKKTKVNDDLNRITYALLKFLGDENDVDRLDQTLISGVINSLFPNLNIMFFGEGVIHSDYMQRYIHGSEEKMPYYPENMVKPSFRGQPVKLFSFNNKQ